MPRFVVRLAFVLLVTILCLSALSLFHARFDIGMDEKPYPLAQPDLSSPRATLLTLLENGQIAHRQIAAFGVPWTQTPAIQRMMDTMNVQDRPIATRELDSAVAASLLLDVVSQVPLPPWSEIPDREMVRQQGITEWQVPGTAIVLERVASGSRAGQFLFSTRTVAHAEELNDAVRSPRSGLPPRESSYALWRYRPGPMIPSWVIETLPSPLRARVAGQAVWQWLGLAILTFVTIVTALRFISWGIRHDAARVGVWGRLGQPLAALAVTLLCYGNLALSQYALKLWGPPLEFQQFLMPLLAIGGLGWLAIACVQRMSGIIVATYALRETSLDAQLVRVVGSLVAITIGIAALFYAADYIGVPLGPLMAGLGIGGLAVALAVRPTLENVIGGLTLFADRPARVGEFCRIGSETGTIEEIGLRTTKIRRLDDTIVTIPNADLAQTRIQNLSRRRRFPFEMQLALPIGTTGPQVRTISEEIEAVLAGHELVNPDTVRVLLTGFGEKTMTLELRAHVDVTRNSVFLAVQHELQLRILEIVKKATEEGQSSTPR